MELSIALASRLTAAKTIIIKAILIFFITLVFLIGLTSGFRCKDTEVLFPAKLFFPICYRFYSYFFEGFSPYSENSLIRCSSASLQMSSWRSSSATMYPSSPMTTTFRSCAVWMMQLRLS